MSMMHVENIALVSSSSVLEKVPSVWAVEGKGVVVRK